jgi:hypothetical protein
MAGSMDRAAVRSDGIIDVSPKRLAEARELWVAERQAELVNVIERHDDLVRHTPLVPFASSGSDS